MHNGSFDWSPLGEAWWRERQAAARASEKQLRFACAYSKCGRLAEAARQAGYGGDARQAGYAALHSTAVVALRSQLSEPEEGGVDAVADRAEMRRIFSRQLRNGSGSDRAKAAEMLLKLDQLDEQDRERERLHRDPRVILGKNAHDRSGYRGPVG